MESMKLQAVRSYLKEASLDAVVVVDSDPHGSEYLPEHWKVREWLSGFTGSAGTLVVTMHAAALWTDSRYFLQAASQLLPEVELMKEGLPDTPEITEWLGCQLQCGSKVAIDAQVTSLKRAGEWQAALAQAGIELMPAPEQMWDELWRERPQLPVGPVVIHPVQYSGESCRSKLERIRQQLSSGGIVLSALDEIAWILNLRGSDVHCCPVVMSYLVITQQEALFYCNPEKVSASVMHYLQEEGVQLRPYDCFLHEVGGYNSHTMKLPASSMLAVRERMPDATVVAETPVALMKAVKNRTELEGLRTAQVRDGVAMVRFLRWLEQTVPAGEVTELALDDALLHYRSQQDKFCGISFDTIAGYGAHGAIVHYEATPESASTLLPQGFLLLDSGGHYLDGTTDITRTIALGPLTDEACRDYTWVLKGHINLATAHFPQGTCGTQLDVLARIAMWKEGVTYLHGTGHGVGSYLNVHEGPHQIRMNHVPTPLRPGMVVTNEPGIYRAGKHGVRIENMMVVAEARETDFGKFYRFDIVTLCPIDTRPIVREMMTTDELDWLNGYHQRVYEALAPHLDEEERRWLKEKTQKI